MYRYSSWTEGCGCCSNSESLYDVYEDGVLVSEANWCDLFSNEQELREGLKHLEPFYVDPDCWWF
jgi:hypothetical protein